MLVYSNSYCKPESLLYHLKIGMLFNSALKNYLCWKIEAIEIGVWLSLLYNLYTVLQHVIAWRQWYDTSWLYLIQSSKEVWLKKKAFLEIGARTRAGNRMLIFYINSLLWWGKEISSKTRFLVLKFIIMELISRKQYYSGKNFKLFGIKWNISRECSVFHKDTFVLFHNSFHAQTPDV